MHQDIGAGRVIRHNVLAACLFDLKFTYILPGWEGTALDSRIIKNALTRNDNLKIPQGNFNSNKS